MNLIIICLDFVCYEGKQFIIATRLVSLFFSRYCLCDPPKTPMFNVLQTIRPQSSFSAFFDEKGQKIKNSLLLKSEQKKLGFLWWNLQVAAKHL